MSSRNRPRSVGNEQELTHFDFDSRSVDSITADQHPQNPFESSTQSGRESPASEYEKQLHGRYFKSRRLPKGTVVPKPWLSAKDPRKPWVSLFPVIGLFVGIVASGLLIWDGLRSVQDLDFCVIYEDDFSRGFDESIWTKEAQVDGYSNGQFDETTVTDENVFVKDNMLYIKPSLQDEALISKNNIINLTASGICTGTEWFQCWTSTNTTNGTIVNPVKSGRINTKKSRSIKYGRIEVEARLPKGDWLWPAIWMMPVKDTYGEWPQSGEIDIVESRGNNFSYAAGGNDIATSALHWGPDSANDAWWRTYGRQEALRSTYADGFHTYGLEWTEKYIFTYVDSRLRQVLYNKFSKPFWGRGDFPLTNYEGDAYIDPWSQTGNPATPFDQPFYLILNVAVGSGNGWFEDGKSGKPWVDKSPSARLDFWNARNEWYPTWDERGEMQVRKVKMMQLKGYQGC